MKLRNKKTGKIIEYSISLNQWSEDDQEWYLFGNYDSIDELKEEWEDYAKKEPLIKDEKIRKAVRAWAEMLGADKARVVYHAEFIQPYTTIYARDELDEYRLEIPCEIVGARNIGYSITELCGSEDAKN